MIETLSDVVELSQREATAFPAIAGRIRLQAPGLSDSELDALSRHIPGMSPTYIEVIRSIQVDGKAIGYFQLYPSAPISLSLVDKLAEANSVSNPLAASHQKLGLFDVAAYDADPICVAGACSRFPAGMIVKYSTAGSTEGYHQLARSFAEFVVLAANIQDLVLEKDMDNPVAKFGDRLVKLGVPASFHEAWIQMAEIALMG